MSKDEGVLWRRQGGPAGAVYWSSKVARRLLARVESGESLRAICADPDMPHRSTVTGWVKDLPRFAAALNRARTAAGWRMRGDHKPRWDERVASEMFARLCEGETMTRICADPDMPSFSTVWRWQQTIPEFAAAVATARRIQAERFCDLGWDIACAVTPQTAFATKVQLEQLRWTAAAMAPRRFGRFKAVTWEDEPAAAAQAEPQQVVFRVRQFEKALGEDGKTYLREVPEAPEGMALSDVPDDYYDPVTGLPPGGG